MKRGIFFWVLAVFFIVGCAAAPPTIEKKDVAAPAVKQIEEMPTAAPRLFEERDLLLDGVALLNLQDRPDPEKARSVFISLIQRYPQSRWRPAAETLVRLIDEGQAMREAGRQDRALIDQTLTEKEWLLQENDRLKKTVRELTDKLQAEKASLSQENEQLRKDLKRLKDLEIELEKRERMLR